MDWLDCKNKRIVKEINADLNKMSSMLRIAESKLIAANTLSEKNYYAKISLMYDSLRSFLEYLALKHGFKIYNHECYTAFLKEILKESTLGDKFDILRKTRNGINYYGKEIDLHESREIIFQMNYVIDKVKELNA